MLANYNQSLVPYAAGAIQMVPGASGYVPSDLECGSGDLELAHSYLRPRHMGIKIESEPYETVYTWNRRPVSLGMSDVGSFIDIYI